jgi:hypothetical protein
MPADRPQVFLSRGGQLDKLMLEHYPEWLVIQVFQGDGYSDPGKNNKPAAT